MFLTGVEGLNKRADVVPSEMIRLNTAIAPSSAPDRLGVLAGQLDGFPNGRRLSDDVIDTILFFVANQNTLGDSVPANDVPFRSTFPFLGAPQQPRPAGTVDDNTRN